GIPRMGRGSLGEVLPASFKALMAAAEAESSGERGDRVLTWQGQEGRVHRFVVPNGAGEPRRAAASRDASERPDYFGVVADDAVLQVRGNGVLDASCAHAI